MKFVVAFEDYVRVATIPRLHDAYHGALCMRHSQYMTGLMQRHIVYLGVKLALN